MLIREFIFNLIQVGNTIEYLQLFLNFHCNKRDWLTLNEAVIRIILSSNNGVLIVMILILHEYKNVFTVWVQKIKTITRTQNINFVNGFQTLIWTQTPTYIHKYSAAHKVWRHMNGLSILRQAVELPRKDSRKQRKFPGLGWFQQYVRKTTCKWESF